MYVQGNRWRTHFCRKKRVFLQKTSKKFFGENFSNLAKAFFDVFAKWRKGRE